MAATVKLAGIKELRAQLKNLIKAVDPDKVEPILLAGAEKIAAAIEKKAPEGPTGNLKKSIKAKVLRRYGKNPAPAIAAVDRKIAPHAHLVQKGTKSVRVAKRGKYKGRAFGIMPKNAFFSKGQNSVQKKVLNDVVKQLKSLVEGAVR